MSEKSKSESEKEKSIQESEEIKASSAAVATDTTSESKADETDSSAVTASQSTQAHTEETPSSVEQQASENIESEKPDQVEAQQSEKSLDVSESQRDEGEESEQKSEEPVKTSIEQRSTGSRSSIMRRRRKGEKVTEKNVRIGFIGAGKMTEVIVKGLLESISADGERINPKQIFVASKSGKNHENYKRLGCFVTKRSYDIFGRNDCDMVFLAVHGYVIRQCYKSGGIRPLALTTNFIPNQRHPLYILSLIGGIPLNDIKRTLLNPDHPEKYRVEMHRIMLNHSVAYGLGIGAIDVEPDSKHCAGLIRNILCRICRLETIMENHMDIACAAGGYGSTFCYYFMAAIADGAFKKGLPKHMATKIAARTLHSAAASIIESGKNPNDLRDACTSPSGPAIYGLHVLDKADCASGFAAAVEAAYHRIKELADNPPT
ncbi:pyrroline-5-carboxylate reductase-like protein [Euroglyphus maynei]|uniref:Pyrroline-5-carboxylate reductase 3 n=1 Tax=Euroglyphus maynei TaxID=6958 RepID=A0A1Y3BNL8_EURMA|nr:pyrroline-5-carboxylate reductase-like protein [Euroglyphus maynei]